MRPRVAVLVPSFNNIGTVCETLESLQSQTAIDRVGTVWLADDGSTDGTSTAAKSTWTNRVPFRVVTAQRNVGQWSNVNAAFDAISRSFDWVLILHSDDIAKPHWIEHMIARAEACSVAVASICSSWDDWTPVGRVVPGEDNPDRGVELIEGSPTRVRDTLLQGCWWHISGCAIRAAAFEAVGPFNPDLPQSGDFDWILRALAAGLAVEYIPRTLIRYRQHRASVSALSAQTDRDIRESIQIFSRYRGLLSRSEVVRWHGRRAGFCARRLGRALVQLDIQRARAVLHTVRMVALSMVVHGSCSAPIVTRSIRTM
jgi:glycosyltransferase involved in cell wall biosynthesis